MNSMTLAFSLALVIATLYGCGGSKPAALTQPLEPQWFRTAIEKSTSFYAYHNLPAPDSLRQRTLTISLKSGIQEQLDVGDVLELAYYSKKLLRNDSEMLADALSSSLQGIQAGQFSPELSEYSLRLRPVYAGLAMSLAHRADSLALATHRQIDSLDKAYRTALQTVSSADTRTAIFFAGHYEKMKRLLSIELELAEFALKEYKRSAERLRLIGMSDEQVLQSRQKFLRDVAESMVTRMRSLETALADFRARAHAAPSSSWYADAVNHYDTLLRLSTDALAQLEKLDAQ